MDMCKECLKLSLQNKLKIGNLQEGENLELLEEVGRKV